LIAITVKLTGGSLHSRKKEGWFSKRWWHIWSSDWISKFQSNMQYANSWALSCFHCNFVFLILNRFSKVPHSLILWLFVKMLVFSC